jgi:nucleoside phosphorylase
MAANNRTLNLMAKFQRAGAADSAEIAKRAKILIVTATPIETAALHNILRPLPPYRRCLSTVKGAQTYNIGRIGNLGVIHVECQMGSVAASASLATVSEALNTWNIACAIMVGIAFGMDKKKQKIGDVLISKLIHQYEIQRIGKKKNLQRGASPVAGAVLLNRFSKSNDWEFELTNGKTANVSAVALLSGEKLIDNAKFKNRLAKTFPDAGGGEMEGAGLFAAAHQKNIPWIVIKGICDFADGNKSRGKKEKQLMAADAAVSFCRHVLSQNGCLEALGCPDIYSNSAELSNGLDINGILFEIYEERFEIAYLQRHIDQKIRDSLIDCGLWVWGLSGTGKTNAIRRVIFLENKKCLSIDLSTSVGDSMDEIFAALYHEIAEKLSAQPISGQHLQSYWVRQIEKIIESHAPNGTYIYIDEIPLAESVEFQKFVDGMAAIIISLSNRKIKTTKFIFSSIDNAKSHLKPFQGKVHQHIRFIELDRWTEDEIKELLDLLLPLLNFKLKKSEKQKIIVAVNGCPRRLKKTLRGISQHRNSQEWPLEKILIECCQQ